MLIVTNTVQTSDLPLSVTSHAIQHLMMGCRLHSEYVRMKSGDLYGGVQVEVVRGSSTLAGRTVDLH